LYHNISNILHY